jgi:hypothetical protein
VRPERDGTPGDRSRQRPQAVFAGSAPRAANGPVVGGRPSSAPRRPRRSRPPRPPGSGRS